MNQSINQFNHIYCIDQSLMYSNTLFDSVMKVQRQIFYKSIETLSLANYHSVQQTMKEINENELSEKNDVNDSKYRTQFFILKQQTPAHIRAQFGRSQVQQLLNSSYWSLGEIKANRLGINCLFQYIKQSKCLSLSLQLMYLDVFQNFINQIATIDFSHIRELDLSYNNIKNIENLAFINMQYLEKINLSNNWITNIDPLNKIRWAKILFINLSLNQLNAIRMNRVKIHPFGSLVENLEISDDQRGYEWIVKTESTKINEYHVFENAEARSRLNQLNVLKSIGRKFDLLKF